MSNTKSPQYHAKVTGLFNQGLVFHHQGQLEKANQTYAEILALQPAHFDALHLSGVIAFQSKNPSLAVKLIGEAIKVDANNAPAYSNLGNALKALKRFGEALASYNHAIKINPNYAAAYYNRGNTLKELNQLEDALSSYDLAVDIDPNYADLHYNRGIALQELNRYQAALASYNKALDLRPDFEYLLGTQLYLKMHFCDWHDFEASIENLLLNICDGKKISPPFSVLLMTDSISIQRKVSYIWINDRHPPNLSLGIIPKLQSEQKIKIGYYSADFREHPVSYLAVELFELHNKDNFELIAFYFGSPDASKMHQRVSLVFDKFINVRFNSDKEVAELSRAMGINIAVDLTGLTKDGRLGIFSYRAAPIQVNYLGYSSTIDAIYYDYIIADKVVIPEDKKENYNEKIIYMPNCYLPRDRTQNISSKTFSRHDFKLPSVGFIFCCFNAIFKITPKMFNSWMKILKTIDHSVIWISLENELAVSNLRVEAEKRGISSSRLIFSPRTKTIEEHLARYSLADLFLDTLPYNAHTTASDALWAGLPVLTCMGESFASRVAASLLSSIDLPELITTTQAEYEAKAIELAMNPAKLKAIKDKLERNRLTSALFDTPRFTKHIEIAFTKMYERYQADLSPDHIYIDAQ